VDKLVAQYSSPETADIFSKDLLMKRLKDDEGTRNTLLQDKFVEFLLDFAKTTEIDYFEYVEKNNLISDLQ
jgi:hypothetical protein